MESRIEEKSGSKGMTRNPSIDLHRPAIRMALLALATCNILVAKAATTVTAVEYFEYDNQGRLIVQRGNNGQLQRRTYDNEGRVISITDALGRTTSLSYDALGRVSSAVNPLNGRSTYAYDSNGQLVSVVDPKGGLTTYARDGFGQPVLQQSPDTGKTSLEYNGAGLPTRSTRNDGTVTTISYDGLGRRVSIKAGTSERIFAYDGCTAGKGRLCRTAVVETATINGSPVAGLAVSDTAYDYASNGWLLRQVDGGVDGNGQEYSDVTRYSYDEMGRPNSVVYPSGMYATYQYEWGQLTAVKAVINDISRTVASTITYQPFGSVASWQYGNGLNGRVTRDLDGRIVGISAASGSSVVQSLTYGFNTADEITTITNGVDAVQNRYYSYDALGRVTAESALSQHWTFDANSNRIADDGPAGASNFTVDPSSNRVLSMQRDGSIRRYGYDAAGNRVSETDNGDQIAAYSYDAFGRMRAAQVSGALGQYTINAFGQRSSKTVGDESTRFVHGGRNRLLAERNSDGWTEYVWMGSQLLGVIKPDRELYYVHGDHLGRPEVVTDSARIAVWRAVNEAWDRDVQNSAFGSLNIGFPGQYFDAESGLWNNGFRDGYDSKLGRYTQPDPMGLGGGSFSTYVYANSNPVGRIDPTGLASLFIGVEADIVGGAGGEFSVGININLSSPADSGIFGSASTAYGANVGASVMAGYIKDMDGKGVTVDANIMDFSPTYYMTEDLDPNGFGISIGPGIGGSFAHGITKTLTLRQWWESYTNYHYQRYLDGKMPTASVGESETVCTGEACKSPPPTNPGRGGGGGSRGGRGSGGGTIIGGGCYGNCGGGGDHYGTVGPVTNIK
jgi:RHS repeat-associated protein